MSQLVTVKSDNHLSRETVQLLVEMKRHLQRYGITVKLADPNVLSHVLQAAESIDDDDALYQGRKRLKALNPNAARPNRVYLFSSSIGRVTCGQCRKAMNVQVHPQAGILNPQIVTCPCGEVLHVGRQREHSVILTQPVSVLDDAQTPDQRCRYTWHTAGLTSGCSSLRTTKPPSV